MNELLVRKYVKEVVKKGVPLLMAKEIVQTAIETGKGQDIQTYIDYALNLVYGMNFVAERKSKSM